MGATGKNPRVQQLEGDKTAVDKNLFKILTMLKVILLNKFHNNRYIIRHLDGLIKIHPFEGFSKLTPNIFPYTYLYFLISFCSLSQDSKI